jgi:putative exosortase-associated protein (TIGR04073 family)
MRCHDRHDSRKVRRHNGSTVCRAAFVVALLTGLLLPASVLAQEMTAARKAGRGLAALTTFPLDLPGGMAQEWRTNGAGYGLTAGFFKGLGKMVVRPVVGVYELVTAPFAIPAGFEPILVPSYPWNSLQADPGTIYGFTSDYLETEKQELSLIQGAVVTRRRGALVVQFPDELLFAPGSAALSPAAQTRLRTVSKVVEANPETRVEILGHTDSSGSPAFNDKLSEQRAAAVRRAMLQYGVDANRVQSQGFGAAAPVASNYTPDGRRSNRRVEIEIRASDVGAPYR